MIQASTVLSRTGLKSQTSTPALSCRPLSRQAPWTWPWTRGRPRSAGLAMAGFSLAREDQLGLLWAIALELFGAGLAVLSLHDTD